jgi:hypothetical protein
MSISESNVYKTAAAAYAKAFTSYAFCRNYIINPTLSLDQRNMGGAQLITTDTITYGPDRLIATTSTGTSGFSYTLQQQNLSSADINTLGGIDTSCRMTTNSNVTFGATSNNVALSHVIEGIFIPSLMWGNATDGQTATFKIWVKTNVVGTHCVSFHNSDCNMSYVAPFSVAVADTWTQTSVTMPAPTSGTWMTNSNAGIIINIDKTCSDLGTGTSNAWVSGTYTCPTSYEGSNVWTTASNYLEITGLQFEKGIGTTFEIRPQSVETSLCQRYFESSMYPYTSPQNNTGAACPGTSMYLINQYGAGRLYFNTTKRGIPSLTFYNPWNSNGLAYNNDKYYTSSNLTALNPNINGFSVTSSDTALQNGMATFNWTASSEF